MYVEEDRRHRPDRYRERRFLNDLAVGRYQKRAQVCAAVVDVPVAFPQVNDKLTGLGQKVCASRAADTPLNRRIHGLRLRIALNASY